MVNDNTPSPRRPKRKRKGPKPRVTPATIKAWKALVRYQKRIQRTIKDGRMYAAVGKVIARTEQWIKAYGG